MEKKTRTWTKWLYWFTFAISVIFVYKTVDNLGQITNWIQELLTILAPFAIGILIAYILYIPCKKIEEIYSKVKKVKLVKKKARPLSILTVYIIVLILIIILFNFIVPPIIRNIIDLANNFGYYYKLKGQKGVSRLLQKILQDHDLNEEGLTQEDITRRAIVNKALIRTMAKAKYQETNIGHFGLGSKCYTHFTSPIRRYPDLLVHRLIKEFMFNESFVDVSDKVSFYNSKVNAAGVNSSKTERIAEKLERDACDYKKCEYMERFYGDKFVGTISSIMNFGAFITLDNTVEGLCRFADMHDDYYVYDEARMCFVGNKFKLLIP